MRQVERYYRVFYLGIFIAMLLTGCLLYGCAKTDNSYYKDFQLKELEKGWYQEDTGEPVELPAKLNDHKDVYTSIFYYLTEDTGEDEVLGFRTDHTFVRVYADDELIYSFGDEESIVHGKTPGSIWNIIPIKNLSAGTKLTVSVKCPYTMYSGKYRMIYQGERADMLLYILRDSAPLLFMCIVPMIVAFFLFIVQFLFYKNFEPMLFFNAACCYLMLTLWSFTEARGWQFFFGNAYVIQMVNFVSFALVIVMIAFSMKQMGFITNEKHFQILITIDILIPILQILLQLWDVVDFFEMLTVIHIMDAVNLFVFLTDFVISIAKKGKSYTNLTLSVLIYFSTILVLALDLMDFYVWERFGNGFFSRIELLIIMTAAGICAVKKSMSLYGENIEKKTYERMAYTDDMTGMGNRRAFDRDVDALEHSNEMVTVLYVDMNGLKEINDTMGHQKGDEAIRIVAEKLLCFTKSGNQCYRLGGDEFCVIAHEIAAKELEEECIRLNEQLKEWDNDFVHPLSIAFGAYTYSHENQERLRDIMREADERMYQKKQQMKGR